MASLLFSGVAAGEIKRHPEVESVQMAGDTSAEATKKAPSQLMEAHEPLPRLRAGSHSFDSWFSTARIVFDQQLQRLPRGAGPNAVATRTLRRTDNNIVKGNFSKRA
jgi:hypothetical protein